MSPPRALFQSFLIGGLRQAMCLWWSWGSLPSARALVAESSSPRPRRVLRQKVWWVGTATLGKSPGFTKGVGSRREKPEGT